jgi:hypothetical protein
VAVLLAGAVPAFASSATFDQANQDYAAGHYAKAARGFDEVIAREGYSVPLLLNAGNAWLKAGEPGRAILNLERAQALAPRDAAVTHNLAVAREQAGLTTAFTGGWRAVVRALSWNAMTWLAVAALGIFCGALLAGRVWRGRSRTTLGLTLTGSLSALLVLAGAMALRWPELHRAVILTADTPARIAPAGAAGVSFTLPAGETVQAQKSHGGFVLVQTSDGRSGWVRQTQVANVMASDRVPEGVRNTSVTSAKSSNT